MAAYFSRADGTLIREYHYGYPREYPTLGAIMQIECVQADGDELQLIFEKCPKVPVAFELHSPLLVQRWFGDTAKFIANAIWR